MRKIPLYFNPKPIDQTIFERVKDKMLGQEYFSIDENIFWDQNNNQFFSVLCITTSVLKYWFLLIYCWEQIIDFYSYNPYRNIFTILISMRGSSLNIYFMKGVKHYKQISFHIWHIGCHFCRSFMLFCIRINNGNEYNRDDKSLTTFSLLELKSWCSIIEYCELDLKRCPSWNLYVRVFFLE